MMENGSSKIDSTMVETGSLKINPIVMDTGSSRIDSTMVETGSSKIDQMADQIAQQKQVWRSLGIYRDKSAPRRDDYGKRMTNSGKRTQLILLTEGFYVGHWRFNQVIRGIGDIVEKPKDYTVVVEAARIAIYFRNFQKGSNLDFVEVVRANGTTGEYYLTIKASDNKFYEAKVYMHSLGKKVQVYFVRPAVHYPKVKRAFLKYDAPDASDEDYAPTKAKK